MLQFLTVGLFEGAIYGLLAVGLVLVYKGMRVFNFAQGEFGTVAAYVLWTLHVNAKVPYMAALAAGLAAAVLLGLVVERLVVRPLFNASRTTLLVATVGVALIIIQVTLLAAKPEPRDLDPIIAGAPIVIFNAAIELQRLVVAGAVVAVAAAMAWFFSRTNTGLAVLAVSQDDLATRVVGISLPGMSRLIWGLAALLGGLAGVLLAPTGVLRPGMLTTTALVPAFSGAVLGGMTSLPGAFLGGILVGAAQQLGVFYLGDTGLGLPGAHEVVVFAMLLLVLLIRPQGILGAQA